MDNLIKTYKDCFSDQMLNVLFFFVGSEQDKKLTNMDQKAIDQLAKELEGEDKTSDSEDAKAKKLAKKKAAIQHRLAAEARKEEKKKAKKKKSDDDDDDDDVALDTFVKPNKKKN